MTGRAFLFAASLVSLNAALLASASAETCVTGVNPTFANVVGDVSGAPGQTVVTAVTPTMAPAVNGVTTSAVPFLTSAALSPGTTGTAITGVNSGSVTGIIPPPPQTPPLPTDLVTIAFSPSASTANATAAYLFSSGGTGSPFSPGNNGSGGLIVANKEHTGSIGPLLTVPVVTGSVGQTTPVLTSVSSTGTFLTNQTTVNTTSASAVTGATSAQFVNGVNVTTAPMLTNVTPIKTSVVNSVTGSNSGASASASSLGCGANAQANGANATAVGTNANTTGNLATALGANSIGIGDGATALGANAVASANGAIAIGASQSTGVNSIAIGTGAVATGSVAVGAAASAANGGAAFGDGATATGLNATAVGPGASATFANSSAIGAGANATAPNQMAFGTASNTYVAPGITSAASKAAQSGPLQIVTSDEGGHLATNTAAGLGLASLTDINAINAQLGGINTRINDLDGRTTKALNGVSMAFAMGGTPWLLPTERFAVTMDWGTFQGTNAVAINGAFRLGTNVQANGGLAYGANGGGAGGRAGVRVGW